MSSKIIRLSTAHRLWWSLPLAAVLWAILLWGMGIVLTAPEAAAPPAPTQIDAQIVELPAKQPPPAPPIKAQAKIPPPATAKPVQFHPVAQSTPVPPKVSLAQPPISPQPPSKIEPPVPVPAPAETESTDAQPGTQQMGARAIYQPKPTIPEDLRDDSLHVVVLARFHIAADGTVSVVLIKPASNPRVNQVVLNTLKTWRYFPAIQAGKPVASTTDVEIAFDVDN